MPDNCLRFAVAMALSVCASNATANAVSPMPFDQQVNEADLVVIATTAAALPDSVKRYDKTGLLQLTKMRVLLVLKGNMSLRSFDFVTRHEISEFNPECCEAMAYYILLLRQGQNNVFEAVNGRYSVILVH